ncbi:MAG: glucose-6-phosphate dehydrogenase assembly protein OpcA [Solirubrobacterales bacterium]|nr:glucose-6-phosphate dehydrogenase assembly protein OpcA [Solirubrobacterales bacterium]
MTEDVWSEPNTTPDAIDEALRRMLHELHAQNQALVPARVLNLVVIVDREWKGEISNRLAKVGRYHASRTILCTVEEGRTKLDGRAIIANEGPHHGLAVVRERVEVDMGPGHLHGIETIVDPVVIAELPTVLWSPHGYEEAVDALLGMTDVMLLDSDDVLEPQEGLARAVDLLGSAYVVDLAWLRTTPWRERLAASFDPGRRCEALWQLDGITIRHRPTSRASALLLAGWLSSRLQWAPEGLELRGSDTLVGAARRNGTSVSVSLEPAEQEVPGLAGVTASCGEEFALSLDRAPGGLRARERVGSDEREWQILGASRGEGGILGEGVRQALLRDPTYGPALDAALAFGAG